jgi:hypothetical protein
MKRKELKPLSPQAARTNQQICSLRRDNLSARGGWIMIDENTVSIAQQTPGESAVAIAKLSRRDFERLVAWYYRPQKRTTSRASGVQP